MSYALSRPSSAQRSGLLGIVIGAHVAVLLVVMAAKTVAPQIMEMPLIVDLLQPPAEQKQPEAKPLPVVKPQPVREKPAPTPKPTIPVLEATQNTQPAPAAPVATPPEVKPAPPAAEPVVQARFDADYLKNPAPPYPPLSKRMGEEGKVMLRVLVSERGRPEKVDVQKSSGYARLDEAARQAALRAVFKPHLEDGRPVAVYALIPINFSIQ